MLPRHLRIIETTLRDQSDHHNELVDEKEWLLWANVSPFDLRCCVLAAEHTLDGAGIAFLQFSPLPHARPNSGAIDFRIRPGYFGLPDIGLVYMEHRYTDWGESIGRI